MDKRIEEKLGAQPVKRIYRYVDNFLVILEDIPSDQLNQANQQHARGFQLRIWRAKVHLRDTN
ncbi:hypothetical protein HPB50_002156 [Hyalomma asiaticum]|uniref:Uncharacterized protein n=1 Tax=Hyalomma asiaticum TaxID=266040 RepID=A0ACB7RNS3_HYAAI|nr:hypothetical protein HPB50_002156 [Hyalomma asiaticum]